MNAWLAVLVAATLEPVLALALKAADGFTRPWPTAIALLSTIGSFGLLSFAMKTLPIGTAYAVWVGLGAAAVAITGVVAFGESLAPARLFSVGLIVTGVIGLKALSP